MGVQGLQTFMEKECPSGFYEIKIKDLIKHPLNTTKPVIVVDGSSCLRHIYGKGDWVFGGQYYYFQTKLEAFVNFFSSLGIHLVFIFDGFTVERKRPRWCERRERAVKDVQKVFKHLQQGKSVESISEELVQFPGGLGMSARIFIKSCKKCTFVTSIEECDEEVTKYAITENCLAILGQDTDYIIYKSAPYYLSMKHLNIEKGTTYVYDRSSLAKQLEIPPEALPLLASLAGNDLISKSDLTQFHERLNTLRGNRFYNVAHYIKQSCPMPLDFKSIPDIAKDVFGDFSKAELLEKSIKSYIPEVTKKADVPEHSETGRWNEIVEKSIQLMKEGDVSFIIYSVIALHKFELSSSLEDRNCTYFPPIAQLYMLLRQRIYGILLHEQPTPDSVTEYCCNNTTTPAVKEILIPAKKIPDKLHPGLMELWMSRDPDMNECRWKLLLWGVTGGNYFPLRRLQALPPQYQVVVLICHYLLKDHQVNLQSFEIAALLIQAIKMEQCSPEILSVIRIQAPDLIAINIATVFLSGALHLLFLNQAVGSPIPVVKFNPVHYFDGPLFHKVYQQLPCQNVRWLLPHPEDADLFNEMEDLVYWNIH